MTLFFHGLWMLCAISTAVFAADGARRSTNLAAMTAGFAIGAVVLRPARLPDVAWIAGAFGLLAVFRLVKGDPRAEVLASAGAGVAAATLSSLFETQGAPVAATLAAAAAIPAASAWLSSRSRGFAPRPLHEEALLFVVALGALLALAPSVVSGWQSAAALNLDARRAAVEAVPSWTILMMLGAASLGGAYSLWTRR